MARRALLCVTLLGLAALPRSAEAADYTFCLRYPDERYLDASVRASGKPCTTNADCDHVTGMTGTCVDMGSYNECEYDFGEDLGRHTGNWKVRRINTYVFEEDSTLLFSGHVGDNGCTPSLSSSSDKFNIYTGAHYRSSATKVDLDVLDCPGDSASNCTYPIFSVIGYDPGSSGTYHVVLPANFVLDAYMAAAYTINRFLGAMYNGDGSYHHIDIWSVGSAGGGAVGYTNWDGSRPVVHLDNIGVRKKFTIAHELGHAFIFDRLGSYITQSSVDCRYGGGGHTVYGLEYQSCANFEGYADFVSAVTWNYLDQNAAGYFVTLTDTDIDTTRRHDIEYGSKELFASCSGSGCTGKGTEMDWARTWWDFRTDGTSGRPTVDVTVDIWEAAAPWLPANGHYTDIYNAVPSGFQSRFAADANYNGTNY